MKNNLVGSILSILIKKAEDSVLKEAEFSVFTIYTIIFNRLGLK